MARWRITVSGKAIRKESIEKLAKAITDKWGKEKVTVQVVDANLPESRSDRFSEAQELVGEARGEMESLRDELQEWYDSIPENLQSGSKADEVQTAIDELETVIQQLEEAEGSDVSFPSMF